jgi:hypothetical protein
MLLFIKYLKKLIKKSLALYPLLFYKYTLIQLKNNSDWINKLNLLFKNTIKFLPKFISKKYSIEIFLYNYTSLIKESIIENDKNFDVFKFNWLTYFETVDEETKIFMTKLFYLSEIFDEDISRKIVNFAIEAKNKDYRYWTTMDISFMTFQLQKGFYPNYYKDRKDLFKQICDENKFITPIKRKSINSRKICIIVYMLTPNSLNSINRVTRVISEALQDKFEDIMVLVLDSFFISKKDNVFFNTIFSKELSKKNSNNIFKAFNNQLTIKFVSDGSFVSRYQEGLNLLYEFNPNTVIDITDEVSPISYIYSKDYFTLYLPIRGDISSSYFTYLLGSKWKFNKSNIKYSLSNIDIIDWTFPEFIIQSRISLNRKDIRVSDNSFVVISIGNLLSTFSNDFLDLMNEFLLNNKDVVWLLVGTRPPLYLEKNYKKLLNENRVIIHGYENNLLSICCISDVLLRQETTGGSGSAAIAASAGLPIVMTEYLCDPMRWLGIDYKYCKSYVDAIAELEMLARNEIYYQRRSKETIEKIKNVSDLKQASESLYLIIENKR